MDDLSDTVTRAQAGDLAAFGELMERCQRPALAQAYAALGDFHLAQDVVQEAFLDAYRSLPGLRVPAAFGGWLRTIVHKHVDRVTRGARPAVLPLDDGIALPADADPAARAERGEADGLIRAAVAGLPAHERPVVAMFYLAGLSTAEIAAGLGLPLTTVKKRLHDARRRLRERMHAMIDDRLGRRPWDDARLSAAVQFLIAVRAGNLAEVRARLAADPALARAAPPREELSAHGRYTPLGASSPLGEAVAGGSRALVAALLDAGADLAAEPLLHEAAIRGHLAVAELLLDRGADVNQPARNGQTALHWALIRGQREMARLLVAHGADVNRPSGNGRTPLHWAAVAGDRAAAEALLAAGADPSLRDAAGRTPAEWAVRRGHAALAGLLAEPGRKE